MRNRYATPNTEAILHQQVCEYLKIRYPRAIFRTDFASGLKLSMPQAIVHKKLQSSRAWPDLQIVEPSHPDYEQKYIGLFIELKRDGTVVFKKDGTIRADPHLQEQAEMLERLRQRGYKAEFAIGFVQAREIIDDYLGGRANLVMDF